MNFSCIDSHDNPEKNDNDSLFSLTKPNHQQNMFIPVTAATLLSKFDNNNVLDSPKSEATLFTPIGFEVSKSFVGQSLPNMNQLIYDGNSIGGTVNTEYSCIECGKRFNKYVALRSHEIVHKAEKSHPCTFCGKAFARRHDMLRHERTVHSAEKSLTCATCSTSFTNLDSLNAHCARDNHTTLEKNSKSIKKPMDSRKKFTKRVGHEKITSSVKIKDVSNPDIKKPVSPLGLSTQIDGGLENVAIKIASYSLAMEIGNNNNGSPSFPEQYQKESKISSYRTNSQSNVFVTYDSNHYDSTTQAQFFNSFPNHQKKSYSIPVQAQTLSQFDQQFVVQNQSIDSRNLYKVGYAMSAPIPIVVHQQVQPTVAYHIRPKLNSNLATATALNFSASTLPDPSTLSQENYSISEFEMTSVLNNATSFKQNTKNFRDTFDSGLDGLFMNDDNVGFISDDRPPQLLITKSIP